MASSKFTLRAFTHYEGVFTEVSAFEPVIDVTASEYTDIKTAGEQEAIDLPGQNRAYKVVKYSQTSDGEAGVTEVESWETDNLPEVFTT